MQQGLFVEPVGFCGRTYPERSPATREQTLLSWLENWLGPDSMSRAKNGRHPVLQSARTDSSSGAFWTRSTSEWNHTLVPSHSDGAVCSLSSILERGQIDPRYFLSQKACAGILRRAEKRGKALPPALLQALQQVAGA